MFDNGESGGGPARVDLDGARADLDAARTELGCAARHPDPARRHRAAYRAALHGAFTAVGHLAGPRPIPVQDRQPTVWALLGERAPGLVEWAWFLAGAGRVGPAVVGHRDADDLVRQVDQFLDLVEQVLLRARRSPADGSGPIGWPGNHRPGSGGRVRRTG